MSESNYRPSGDLQGDTSSMPSRGTSTGMGDTYGADLGQDSTNSMGKITGATKSDQADQCYPKDQQGLGNGRTGP